MRDFAAAITRATHAVAVAPADLWTINAGCAQRIVPRDAIVMTRAPYITDATQTSVTLNFATDRQIAVPAVWFGRTGTDCHTNVAIATRQAELLDVGGRVDYETSIILRGLSPGTRYCYQLPPPLFLASVAAPPREFVTAFTSDDRRSFSFAVLGDWGGGSAQEARVMSEIAASDALFVVTTGDNAYPGGTQTDYGDLDGGNVFGADFLPVAAAGRPIFASSGNHGFSNFHAALANWPQPEVVRASGGRQQADRYCCIPTMRAPHTYASSWYAFDWGPARFYMLDASWADSTGGYAGDFAAHWNGAVSGCPVCGAERAWLQSDLASHRSVGLKFAFFHYPLHADATDHGSDAMLDGPNSLEGLLARNGVDIVFNGHAHLYERNRPMIPGSPMISYVTGGGGVNLPDDTLAGVKACSAFDAYAIGAAHSSCRAPKPASADDVYHFLLVSVDRRQVTVTPTNANGATFDVHTWSF